MKNWPAQLKTVVDRFYSFTTELSGMRKKAALLAVAWDNTDTVFKVTKDYYDTICDYMHFQDCGVILGGGQKKGHPTREEIDGAVKFYEGLVKE